VSGRPHRTPDSTRDGQQHHEHVHADEAPPSSAALPAGEAHAFAHGPDGTRLFVRTKACTNGAPDPGAVRFVLCDGILCDGFIWKYLWKDLAAVAPLVHWHYRGHGRSGRPVDPERIDIGAHAEDLWAVRQHVGDPPVVLVGHSMGCQVALECYRRHPGNVRGLILECGTFGKVTSTFRGVPILDMVLPKLLDVALKAPEVVRAIWSRIPPEIALKVALKAGEIDPEKVHPEDVLPYLHHMTHVDFPLFLRMLRAAGEHTASDWLGEVSVPTLIIAGERDTFTPSFLAQSMQQAIPDAELMMVARGTHVAPIEQPEAVNARIESFYRERVLR
jgi:pimeloyl-ACP methyl ester carboxylesterase